MAIHIRYLAHAIESRFKSFRKVPLGDSVEYTQHRVFVEVVNGNDLEMAHEACRYVIATAAWWTHCADKHLYNVKPLPTNSVHTSYHVLFIP